MRVLGKWFEASGCDNHVDDPFVSDSSNLLLNESWRFREGKLCTDWDPSSWIKSYCPEGSGNPDDVLQNHLGLPIFSKHLRRLIEEEGIKGVQFLPLEVFRQKGPAITGYSIANVLNVTPAMDLQRSRYDVFPPDYFLPERRGEVLIVHEMVLQKSQVMTYDIMRVKQFMPALVVSQKFKELFEAAHSTGYSFKYLKTI
jgi:hypothetical protein